MLTANTGWRDSSFRAAGDIPAPPKRRSYRDPDCIVCAIQEISEWICAREITRDTKRDLPGSLDIDTAAEPIEHHRIACSSTWTQQLVNDGARD